MVINDEDIEIIEEEPEEEGGKRYNCQEVFPLKPEGSLKYFDYYFGDSYWSYRFTFEEGKIDLSLNLKQGYNSYKYQGQLKEREIKKLEEYAREAALMNGWCVETNGLPVSGDCNCTADFKDGSHVYFSFNGHDCPPGFDELNQELLEYLKEISDYSEDKLEKYVPPVNPYYGKHFYEDEKDGKIQSYTVIMYNIYDGENCEFISEGPLGSVHMKCHHKRVYGSRLGDYYIEMLDYYADSKDKKPYEKGHLMATMKHLNGVMYLNPCYGLNFNKDGSIIRKEFEEL